MRNFGGVTTYARAVLRRCGAVLLLVFLVGGACSRTLPRVSGKVLDARTDRPLGDVSVTTGVLEAKTGQDGAFALLEVPKNATIRFEKANWRPRAARAPEDATMTVRLVPIPVLGKVTSALSGEGVPARLEGTIDELTAADGSFTVYGVGPGDRLKVSARFHKSAEASITAGRSLTVTLDPARVDPESAFVPVEGYALTEMPRQLKEQLAADLYQDPDIARANPLLAGRSVKKGSTAVAVVVAVALDPGYAASPGASEAFFQRLASNARTRPEMLTIAGTAVQLSQGRDGSKALGWRRYTVFFILMGKDRPELEALARALIEATQ